MGMIAELRRRNVFRVAIAYAVLAWVVIQVTDTVAPALGLPEWTLSFVVWGGIVAFPFVLLVSWLYQLTPEGLMRDDGEVGSGEHGYSRRPLNLAITALLCVALVLVIVDSYILAPAPPASGGARDSIAVLPFVNLSGDPQQEYFSDGLSEELLNLLARQGGLKVAARTSSFTFKGRNVDIREVGTSLGVGTVLEGSVRRSGEQVRVTAQLIDVVTGYHLWSDNFDRRLVDIFAIQDQIAAAIVDALQIHLDTGVHTPPAAQRSTSPAAYDLYLKGLEAARGVRDEQAREALELFRAATESDPDFAPAWAARARMVMYLRETAFWGEIPRAEAILLARQAIDRAQQLDPDLAEAHVAEAYLLSDQNRYPEAEASLQRAIALNPNHAEALHLLATVEMRMGRIRSARDHILAAVARDPLQRRYQFVLNELVSEYSVDRDQARELIEAAPEDSRPFSWFSFEVSRGQVDAARYRELASEYGNYPIWGTVKIRLIGEFDLELLAKISRHPGEFAFWGYIDAGRWDDARALYEEFQPERREAVINLEEYSIMQAATGDCAGALDTLEQAHGERVPVYGRVAPSFNRANSQLALNRVYCLRQLGRGRDAEKIFARVTEYLDTLRANAACCYALLEAKWQVLKGDPAAAIATLAAGVPHGDISWRDRYDPVLMTLRGEPEFERLQQQLDARVNSLRDALGLPPVSL